MAALYGLFVIRWRANQIVAGTAINLLALGMTPFLCKIRYDVAGSTPMIPLAKRFHDAPLCLSWGMVACLLFGFADVLQNHLQSEGVSLWGRPIPVQFIQILPYLATLVVLAGFVGRSRAPKARGRLSHKASRID
jgi:ABC-type uncharacterized transport system permease subunit